jgi:hypothetical protein
MELISSLGTRHWLPQIMGSWTKDELDITVVDKHILPKEILDTVPLKWESVMRAVGEQELGKEGEDWRIVPAEPYAKMEIKKGTGWGLRMFAGDQTRTDDYSKGINGRLNLVHSPANYAESLATNNTDPWGLITKYGGRLGLADGHAVSVAVTGLDAKGRELMEFFERGLGLGEYDSYLGTAAGK